MNFFKYGTLLYIIEEVNLPSYRNQNYQKILKLF